MTRALIRRAGVAGACLAILTSMLPAAVATSAPTGGGVTRAPLTVARGAGPAVTRPATAITPASCALVGVVRTCQLWAKTGTIDLPGHPGLAVLGFAPSAAAAAQVPGPTIDANVGETIVIVLHNTLSQNVSLAFPGQRLAPDTTGAPGGGLATYTLSGSGPGTFLYEAGLTSNGPRQVAMGLYGALVVRPVPSGTAYGSGTAYDTEQLVIFGGIDPSVNGSPSSDLVGYEPTFWVINGRSYPDTDPIEVHQDDVLLVRYINAGLAEESMGLIGLRQTIIATDGKTLVAPLDVVAETVPAGGTMDALVTIPASAPIGHRWALGSAHWHLFNGSTSDPSGLPMGGLLTFVTVVAVPEPAVIDTRSPLIGRLTMRQVAAGPRLEILATADDRLRGDSVISRAEWFIGADPGVGRGSAMAPADGAFNGPLEQVRATLDLATLRPGRYVISVRARDVAGNWTLLGTIPLAIPDLRFRDGFESGTVRAWSSARNPARMAVLAAARLQGTRGLRVTVRGTTPAYLVDSSPARWTVYRAQVLFDPRATATGGKPINVFVGRTAAGTTLFRIQYRRTSAAQLQVRAVVRATGGEKAGAWIRITNARHLLDLAWRASPTGGVVFRIDGIVRSSVAADTRTARLDEVRLGAISGMVASASGRFIFDGFVSARDTILQATWPQ